MLYKTTLKNPLYWGLTAGDSYGTGANTKKGKTFSYAFEAGIVNGKRKVVEKGGFLTKSEAYKAGAEAYTDFLHGNIGIVSESVTLRIFMGRWLDNVVALNVRASSMQTYQSRFENQIAPYLGEVKVQEITPALLDDWIRRLLKAGLSRNTLLAVHALLHGALNYAVHPSQLISSNPAAYIKVPKNAPRNVIARHIITPEQFNTLLRENPFGTPLYIPLLILYHTGMRISEVLGLTWQDIDFPNKQITLKRQFIHLNNQGYFFTPLKTETSNRCILIDDYLLNELRRWQVRQIENKEQYGNGYVYIYCGSGGHVSLQTKSLPTPEGDRVSLVCVQKNGKSVLQGAVSEMLRIKGLNAHSFRHTHATQLIEHGAPLKAVAGRLGHSTHKLPKIFTHTTHKNYRKKLP